MIKLHRLNKQEFMLNSDLIEYIDEVPDTTVSMTSGRKFVVTETADDIRKSIIRFKREIAEKLLMEQ